MLEKGHELKIAHASSGTGRSKIQEAFEKLTKDGMYDSHKKVTVVCDSIAHAKGVKGTVGIVEDEFSEVFSRLQELTSFKDKRIVIGDPTRDSEAFARLVNDAKRKGEEAPVFICMEQTENDFRKKFEESFLEFKKSSWLPSEEEFLSSCKIMEEDSEKTVHIKGARSKHPFEKFKGKW